MRKIISIAVFGNALNMKLAALCDDGTLWEREEYDVGHGYDRNRIHFRWRKLIGQGIPQTDEDERAGR